jgi:hypothetical protein
MVVIAAGAIGALTSMVAWYYIRRARQRRMPAILRFCDAGIQHGANLEQLLPWTKINAINERIDTDHGVARKAVLYLQLVDGRTHAINLTHFDQKPDRIIDAARELLRNSRGVSIHDIKDFATPVQCPICGKETLSLKSIQSGTIVFLFIHARSSLKKYACCRRCARRIIARDSAVNLITCNIAWPIAWVGAVIIPQLGKLVLSGHDLKALEKVV